MNNLNETKSYTNLQNKTSANNYDFNCNLKEKINVKNYNDILKYNDSKIDFYLEKIISKVKEAISYKQIANKLFKHKNYEESLKHYKKVI